MRRSRTIAADPAAVWSVVSDPYHLPRWWPGLQRVEEVSGDTWTKVLATPKGKTVRADFTLLASEPPSGLAWRQEVDDSPFERFLREAVTEISLKPAGEGSTRVELRAVRRLRGLARFGAFMVRRAARRQLDEALSGLQEATSGRPAA